MYKVRISSSGPADKMFPLPAINGSHGGWNTQFFNPQDRFVWFSNLPGFLTGNVVTVSTTELAVEIIFDTEQHARAVELNNMPSSCYHNPTTGLADMLSYAAANNIVRTITYSPL